MCGPRLDYGGELVIELIAIKDTSKLTSESSRDSLKVTEDESGFSPIGHSSGVRAKKLHFQPFVNRHTLSLWTVPAP